MQIQEKLNSQSKADAPETEPPEALSPGEEKNPTPSISGIPQASKTRKSLFDDDEEDEEDDLFSSLLKTKPPVTKVATRTPLIHCFVKSFSNCNLLIFN